MKISRSYLLGLGSGLILSALLAMVVPTVRINFDGDLPANKVSQEENLLNGDNEGSQGSPEKPGVLEEGPSGSNLEPNSEPTQLTEIFVIPSGSTADRIADLLLAEEWISSKEEFLDLVEERNLARSFRAGSFELTQGMNVEEILEQLVPMN